MIKKVIKSIVSYFAPSYYLELKSQRARAHSEKLEREWGCSDLTRKIIEMQGPVVKRGPFAGVEFVDQTHHRHLTPKLIGAYESELHPAWDKILREDYEQVLDVGSAEGYYAVGLALHYPQTEVIAFDTDTWARRMTTLMAKRNDANNLTVRSVCTADWLKSNLKRGAFILSDCEGFEDQLIDPEKVPVLRTCDLLIELHESPAPGVTERMKERLSSSHDLTFMESQETDPSDYPELQSLSKQRQNLAVSDLRSRGDQEWLYARAK